MSTATLSTSASITLSLALFLTAAGCKSNQHNGDASASATTASGTSKGQAITFPQTTETIVNDPAHPPRPGAAVVRVYDDKFYGKTEVRDDDYMRHADAVSPTRWTPWHYRTHPHNWAPLSYETITCGAWTVKVQSVDPAARLITLEGPSGRTETFFVSPQVQRLAELNAGDNLTVTWSAAVYAELRPATPEESAEPIKVYTFADRATSDANPNPDLGTAVRVVTTVDVVDLTSLTVTLKGPLGNRLELRAKNPENIRKLHVGDTIVVLYTRGEVLSVTKS